MDLNAVEFVFRVWRYMAPRADKFRLPPPPPPVVPVADDSHNVGGTGVADKAVEIIFELHESKRARSEDE